MSFFIPPQSRLAIARREPSLLVPDKKPIGSVVVNNKRATRNLRGYYLVRSAADKNIAGDDLAIGSASDVMFDELGSIYNPATAGLHCGDVHDYPSELTILSRIYWVSAGSTYSTIAARRAGATYQYQFRVWVNNLNFLGAGGSRTSTLVPVSNAWNNVAVAASAAGVLFYCNGSTTTASSTALTSKSTTFSLGSTSDNSHPLGAGSYLRFVKVYDRRLTAEEIEAEFSDPYKDLLPANAAPYLFGEAAAGGFTGTGAGTLEAIVASASGSVVGNYTGTAAGTLAAITGSATGTLIYSGTAAGAVQAITGSATGSFSSADFQGTGAGVLSAITGSASGAVSSVFEGSASGVLSAITASATGTVVTDVTGTAAGALSAITAAGVGTVQVDIVASGNYLLVVSPENRILTVRPENRILRVH